MLQAMKLMKSIGVSENIQASNSVHALEYKFTVFSDMFEINTFHTKMAMV